MPSNSQNSWYAQAFRQKPVQYIVLGLVFVALIYVIGRMAGRNSFADYKPTDLPEEPNWSPYMIVEEAWDVLNGWFSNADSKEKIFVALLALSDRQLNEVYNLYNGKYGKADGYTLTKKIANESYVSWFSNSRSEIVKRLRTMGLY